MKEPKAIDEFSLKESKAKDRKEQREKKKFDFEKNGRTIFIGNLPSAYDHRDVVKLFKQCGPVESARIRSVIPEKEKMPPKVAEITKRIHPKIDSINAYLVFNKDDENEKHILKALAMNGKLVDEHHIRVDRAQHPNSKRLTLTSRKKSVFVGNLRFDIRDDDLIKHFEKIGPVDYVRLVRDRATGLGKGFGFVKFKERAPVKEAMKLNDTQFQGRDLRVKKVDEDAPTGDSRQKAPTGKSQRKEGPKDESRQENASGKQSQRTEGPTKQFRKKEAPKGQFRQRGPPNNHSRQNDALRGQFRPRDAPTGQPKKKFVPGGKFKRKT